MVKSVQHAVDILQIIAKDAQNLGVSEIARRAGLSKSATFDILTTLESRQLVARDPDASGYRLGFTLAHLAAASRKSSLHRLVRPSLYMLATAAHESAFFGVLASDHAVYLSSIQLRALGTPRHTEEFLPVDRDQPDPLPLHATAGGKVLLAYQRDSLISRVVRRARPFTPHTITAPTMLTEHLRTIRQRAYATCWEEHHLGVSAVSIPIRGRSGVVVAALTVSGPSSRLHPDDTQRLLQVLRSSAQQIETRIGSEAPTPPLSFPP